MRKILAGLLLGMFIVVGCFASDSINQDQLTNAIQKRLYEQTGDKKVSQELTKFIMSDVLTWKAKSIDISKANSILAFSFGNAYAKNGNQKPGKMNYELADLVISIYNKTHLPVYAQWEIAQAIGNRIPQKDLHTIYPKVDSQGNLVYLDTKGVAKEAIKEVKGVNNLGTAVVIAFKEHELRAVRTSQALGIKAFAPKGYKLPDTYDKYSGQPWTRDKLTFMLYEIRTRANIYRENLNGMISKK
ncbi:hypothetical protein [Francisella sp. LA112445]|uniref:hypothetical protein n=1 Tax=Francisella sp. LA112445 TaxID=1395624 RepID=UPI001AE84C8C|nr:hypothetical protein [Francisella sp. LA112445]